MREAEAIWNGNLKEGEGRIRLGNGEFQEKYSFSSRFETGSGTNPEELIAAAHAGCFSMALAKNLADAGFTPKLVETTAKVRLVSDDSGFTIKNIHLETEGVVPEIDEGLFEQHARDAKANCPVSKALQGPDITLDAKLLKG